MTGEKTDAGVQLLMFDLDGTLIDSRRDIAAAVNLMRFDYKLDPLPVEVIQGFIGDGIEVLVARALRGTKIDVREATERCSRHYREHLHDATVLYPGVADGLRRLHAAGFAFALISNKPSEYCSEILRHFEILPLFECVLGGGDTNHLKPNPQPLIEAMKRVGANPETSWMIGDHKTDLEAARRAGIRSVFLTYGIGEQGHEMPTFTTASFMAATEFLLTQGAA